jgi:hypothetical protein
VATEARLTREEAAAWRTSGGLADVAAAGRGPRWAHGCPYRGLQPFDEADAEVFYGRERLTAELVGRLAGQRAGKGILVVTGASGAGKSSLLRAGLLPALARGLQLPGSARWPRVVLTPTGQPLAELATRLAVLGGTDAAAIRRELTEHPERTHLAVRHAVIADAERRTRGQAAAGGDAGRLLLIVDQFEQLFTLSSGGAAEVERQAFITALCAVASNPAGPPTSRPDWWSWRCAGISGISAPPTLNSPAHSGTGSSWSAR